jgi:hypothetical protein
MLKRVRVIEREAVPRPRKEKSQCQRLTKLLLRRSELFG